MVGLAPSLEWILNVLVGLGILSLLVGTSYLVLRRKANFDKALEETDRRYAESEVERKRRESRWSN